MLLKFPLSIGSRRYSQPQASSRLSALLMILIATIFIISCETVIHPDLQNSEPVFVVDAWLTNEPKVQLIKLSQTQPYFDNRTPPPVSSAIVTVKNETDGRIFYFNEEGTTGNYQWTPASPNDSIGKPGDAFSLAVKVGSATYESISNMGRVPKIDSITFTFEKASAFFPDYYAGEFWATDPPGPGDTYWIKAWKNDTLLLKPSEINIAFDAGFSEGGNIDGVTFITPIRQAISPFDADDNGRLIPPYKIGDSVYVEILSISKPAFTFLNEVSIQTDRPGGFAELFASPFSNVTTNITSKTPNAKKAVGFFNVGTVSGRGKRLVE